MELLIEGIFEANERGFGFVRPDDENLDDIFIPPMALNEVFHGDRVLVQITNRGDENKGPEGVIKKILERGNKKIIGKFEKSKNFAFVIPENKKIQHDIFIPKSGFNKAKNGDMVAVEITKWPKDRRNAEGKVTKVLGKIGKPGVDILTIMYEYNLSQDFPAEVIAETSKIPDKVEEKELKNRVDLRAEKMVTIDGEDAKDLDDAVSISKLSNGNFLLGVHIADVSHYVKEGSPLDKEALSRATSVYLVDRVIPMLPKELSNGICSLNAGQDRLAFSVKMEIDKKGKIVNSDIFKSVINVNERMNYTDVAKILEDKDKKLCERYKDFVDDFELMRELSDILRNRRFVRGAIDFNVPEAKVILDSKGKPKEVKKYELTIANNIIEDFMLAANETVAEKFFWLEAPFVYRIHDVPDGEKMEDFTKFIYNYGYKVKGISKLHPKALQELLKQIKGKPEERVISTLMLRSMQQAKYAPENSGHFGLAAEYYCHFTSPIRRYPDLFIHRVMSEMLNNGYKFKNDKRVKKLKKLSVDAATRSSEMERNAVQAERDSVELKMVEYMSEFIGEEFDGIISSVTSFGFFVELDNTIEGLVRVENIEDDYYVYNEKFYSLVGERTKKTYRLGDTIRVKLVRADVETKRIDFVIV